MTVPTIKDVALRSGVSVGTVSRYLNGASVKAGNREAIEEAVRELGYVPNIMGRSLTTKRTYSVGVLISSAANPFVGALVGLIEREFERLGYASLFVEYQDDAEQLRSKVAHLESRQADGLVVLLSDLAPASVSFLGDVSVPLVLADNSLDVASMDSVVVDNRSSTEFVVGRMLDAGHRRVGVLALPQDTYVGRERLEGWRAAHAARGIPCDETLAHVGRPTKADAAQGTAELLDAGATAIFACNYYTELGALHALARRGLRPGVDVGFAGFDALEFGDVLYPEVTTVVQPIAEMARVIASILVGRMGQGLAPDGRHVLTCSVRITESITGSRGCEVASVS